MAIQQADYGFTVQQQNGKTVFTYQQQKYGHKNLLLFSVPFSALIGMFIAGAINPRHNGFLIWLVFAVPVYFLIKYIVNLTRGQKQFIIDRHTIEVDGQQYERKDITDLYVAAGRYKHGSNPENAAYITGAAGAYGNKMNNQIWKINYRILMRYGRKIVKLASGVSLDTAEVMLEKIKETAMSAV